MLKTPYRRQQEPDDRCEFLEFLDSLGRMDMLRLRILLAVAKRPHMHASHYAWLLGVNASALCKVVRSMSAEGHKGRPHMAQGVLVRRPSVDRRQKVLSLSARGLELLYRVRAEVGGLVLPKLEEADR